MSKINVEENVEAIEFCPKKVEQMGTGGKCGSEIHFHPYTNAPAGGDSHEGYLVINRGSEKGGP